MPPPSPNPEQTTACPRSYGKASTLSKSSQSAVQSKPKGNTETVVRPLPPRQETVVDLLRELVRQRHPSFQPRNTMDIVSMAESVDYDGPTDHDAICAYIDGRELASTMAAYNCSAEEALVIGSRELDEVLGSMPATEAMGVKPRAGQSVSIRTMPSCPMYSIRLWASSSVLRQFGMDFIESATGAPVNMSHRFHLYGTNYMLGSDMSLPIEPFNLVLGLACNRLPGPGEEVYHLHAEQEVVIWDTASAPGVTNADANTVPQVNAVQQQGGGNPVVRMVKFKVPKHPLDVADPQASVIYDELHFSLDT